jgi:hypothetical protein
MLRDIRELADQQEAYADELRRRWGGLLSYRYIGRMYASMDPRAVEDMRNPTSGRDVRRIEIVSEELKVGRQMGDSRAKIVDAERPDRVLALIEGHGMTIGIPPEGLAKMEVGPFRVETEAMAGCDGTVGARVVLHDEGADDKAITAGSYVFAGSR